MSAPPDTVVIVSARNEADRLPATLRALAEAFPGAQVVVADDCSTDETPHIALQAGVDLVRSPASVGKGGTATLAAERMLARSYEPDPPVFVLCDGDLGTSAGQLAPLAAAVRDGDCDLAIGAFARRVGGGFGIAVRFAGWAIERRCGLRLRAPISGQRALRGELLSVVVPFAPGFGMETAMTIDAVRAGYRLREFDLDLEHRATGRTLGGFVHRGRQLIAFARVYLGRR
ncbi:MAG TPA: glycosyltransferase [Solirubrobacteraceae bacterium]|nr:glycosyltransferase [Solirubrobacteraceae bacterium]